MTPPRRLVALLAVAALAPLSCSRGDRVSIQGAGATFPAPLSQRWFKDYNAAHPAVQVDYQAIGSGAGVTQFREGLTDFAQSDEALTAEKLAQLAADVKAADGLVQAPLAGGAVALCYNLPGRPELKLSREVYVGMALGRVKNWNDPAVVAANPGVALPDLPITFVRRAESSGTTFVFTSHLAAIDDRWKAGPGAGKTVTWPVGVGGKSNAGVAGLIAQTPGAFGYVEAGFAESVKDKVSVALIENKSGKFVGPTLAASVAGLEGATLDDVLSASVPDPAGPEAYPIVTYTYVITRKTYADAKVGTALREVLLYCLGDGQPLCGELGYVQLPPPALEKARAAVGQIQAGAAR